LGAILKQDNQKKNIHTINETLDSRTMRQIIFIAILSFLVSCGQDSATKSTNNQTNIDKNSVGQTETNEQPVNSTETKIGKDNKPVDIALTFINSYADNCNKMKEAIGIVEWVNSNELSTNNFKKEVKRIIEEANEEDPELGLGFDPIFDAQDFDNRFELEKLEKYDDQTNFIVVKGKEWTAYKLTIKVVLENNKWLVDGCGIVNIPDDRRRK
jgi:hypothetical protein